jgi:glutathione S-transferase
MGELEAHQSADVSTYNHGLAERFAKWLDAELGRRPWIAGDRFTIADITAACGMDFAKMMKWRPGPELPNLMRWRAALGERAAGKVAA